MEDASGHHYPAVTSDIAVFVPGADGARLLLIRRRLAPFQGQWALPGGFLDRAETIEACARRELHEETGLSLADLRLVGVYSAPERDPRGRTLSIAFGTVLDDTPRAVRPDSDAAEARWFALDRLPDLAFDHARIIDDARALFADRL
jgi:8-oxo-dGTP diphosphatase